VLAAATLLSALVLQEANTKRANAQAGRIMILI
jgi:hypothetical protein